MPSWRHPRPEAGFPKAVGGRPIHGDRGSVRAGSSYSLCIVLIYSPASVKASNISI